MAGEAAEGVALTEYPESLSDAMVIKVFDVDLFFLIVITGSMFSSSDNTSWLLLNALLDIL